MSNLKGDVIGEYMLAARVNMKLYCKFNVHCSFQLVHQHRISMGMCIGTMKHHPNFYAAILTDIKKLCLASAQ